MGALGGLGEFLGNLGSLRAGNPFHSLFGGRGPRIVAGRGGPFEFSPSRGFPGQTLERRFERGRLASREAAAELKLSHERLRLAADTEKLAQERIALLKQKEAFEEVKLNTKRKKISSHSMTSKAGNLRNGATALVASMLASDLICTLLGGIV